MQYLREQQYKNLFEEKVQEDGARKQKTALALRVALHWNPKNNTSGWEWLQRDQAQTITHCNHAILKAYLPYQGFCQDHSSPDTPTPPTLILLLFLHRVFVCLCLEQLDEMSDAPLPNVTSSQSFPGNKLALS